MKNNSLLLMIAAFLLAACNKQAGSDSTALQERVDTTAAVASGTKPGMFVSYGENVAGTAKVYNDNGKLSLALENFSTNNGPDLHVYLSKEVQPTNFIDLGKLKSTSGNQVYTINGMPDLTQYKYALIHCQQYNHLFGSALLVK